VVVMLVVVMLVVVILEVTLEEEENKNGLKKIYKPNLNPLF
jgi:hypothetical protein